LKEKEEEKDETKKGRLERKGNQDTDSELKKTRIEIPGLY
jgi:hypothetical protein